MSITSPDQVFDELLVMRYQAGDQKALELLIKRWSPKIMQYAFRNIKDQQGTKDVAQEVWLAVINGIQGLSDHTKFGSWVLGITHNQSMNWIKKNTKRGYPVMTERNSSKEKMPDELIKRMRSGIQKLNANQRNVLTLFYLEGYSLIEIADILSISKGTVKSRLFYARESLKKAIKIYDHE